MYDLPSENPEEPGLPDEFHDLQPQLLSRTLRLNNYTHENCFTASNLNLYYDVNHPPWYKRPDWFLAVDVPRLYDGKDLRRSYVVWQEGKSPYVAIEFLSPGTEVEDLGRFYNETSGVVNAESATPAGNPMENALEPVTKPPTKVEVYEQYLRIPHYLVYSRYTQRLRYLKLDGGQYQEQSLSLENSIAWLADLEIGLGIWEGVFEDVPGYWLRWCDDAGNWFLTDTEQARMAREQAEAQLLQAARNLLATGMEIAQVATILGLSEAQVQAIESSH
jgi:Uma2 family endonuclease